MDRVTLKRILARLLTCPDLERLREEALQLHHELLVLLGVRDSCQNGYTVQVQPQDDQPWSPIAHGGYDWCIGFTAALHNPSLSPRYRVINRDGLPVWSSE